MKKLIALGIAVTALLALSISPASAQDTPVAATTAATEEMPANPIPDFESEGFTISPAYPNSINPRQFIYELKPGQKTEDYVYVRNLSKETANFYLYGADPTFSAQGTPAYKTRQAGGNGEGQWLTFENPQIELKGGEARKVKFTLTIPSDAGQGEYRIGVAMEKTKLDTNNPNVTIATRVILHTKVVVTDNPQAVPREGMEGAGAEPGKTSWQTYYFWISLALFITSFAALIWVTLSERQNGRRAMSHEGEEHTKAAPKKKRSRIKKTARTRKK